MLIVLWFEDNLSCIYLTVIFASFVITQLGIIPKSIFPYRENNNPTKMDYKIILLTLKNIFLESCILLIIVLGLLLKIYKFLIFFLFHL